MKNFVITYYIGEGIKVEKNIQSNSIEEATRGITTHGIVNFTDEKGVFYSFNKNDVKLTTVTEVK